MHESNMTSARPTSTPALNLMPNSAYFSSYNDSNNKHGPDKLILHLLRAISVLSTLASVFLLCYMIRSEDAQRLFLQLLNAANGQEERKDAAVEQSAGARSILVAIYSCLVTSCTSNYFLLREKNNVRTRAAVLMLKDGDQTGLSEEGFVLASLSCSSHTFISFLLFGTFRINLYNGIQPGELAAFFVGLISLVQTVLFLVLAALIVKREKIASKLASGSNAAEMTTCSSDWNLSSIQQDEVKNEEIRDDDGGDTGTTDFVKMTDVKEDKAGEVVLV